MASRRQVLGSAAAMLAGATMGMPRVARAQQKRGGILTAILNPEPPLFGKGAKGRADVEMWTRRVELRLMVPLSMVWMHTHPYTARVVVPQFTEFGESNRPKVITALTYFNQILADRDYLTGAEFSIADIVLLTTIDFATFIGMALPAELTALKAWHERVSQRPSATA